MNNVIDITTLIADLKRLDDQENQVLVIFLSAIKEYSALLLSKDDKCTKLVKSLHLLEKINPAFLNIYFSFRSDDPNETEKRVVDVTERLRLCTDEYYGLMEHDMSEEELKAAIKLYEAKIIELVEEYKKAIKAVVRSEMINEHKENTP